MTHPVTSVPVLLKRINGTATIEEKSFRNYTLQVCENRKWIVQNPMIWCSDQAGFAAETLRKVDQWQRALQMAPSQAAQAAQATCNVVLAAIPAWQDAISFLLLHDWKASRSIQRGKV